MTLTKKLLITLVISLVSLLLASGMGVWQLNQAQSRFDYVQANTFPSLDAIVKTEQALASLRSQVRNFLLATTPQQKESVLLEIDKANKTFDQMMVNYVDLISNDQDRQLLETDKRAIASYREAVRQIFAMEHAGHHQEAVHALITSHASVVVNKCSSKTNVKFFSKRTQQRLDCSA